MPLLLSAGGAAPAEAQPQGLDCPERIGPSGPGDPRFEQIGLPPAAGAPLRGARMFDGPPGEEREEKPVEVPAQRLRGGGRGEVLGWPVAMHGSGLLLVCLYGQTRTYLRAVVPRTLERCEIVPRERGGVAVTCR